MWQRFAPIALVVVAACHTTTERASESGCSTTPNVETCGIIGTWECRVTIPHEDGRGPKETLVATETYEPNGAWSMPVERVPELCGWALQRSTRADGVEVILIEDPVQLAGRWRVIREDERRIVVEVVGLGREGESALRILDVVDDDHLAFRENDFEYRLVRVN